MTIASEYATRYHDLPEEWERELDIWGGDCSVSHTMHYGEPFNAFLADIKAEAVSVKYDDEYCLYSFEFADGSSAELDNISDTFRCYN